MHASGGDADFRAHAEFAAIGELCRCIDHDDGAVDPLQVPARFRSSVMMQPWVTHRRAGRGQSSPSTTRTEMMLSRYSVAVASVAGSAVGTMAHVARRPVWCSRYRSKSRQWPAEDRRNGLVDKDGLGRAADPGTPHLGATAMTRCGSAAESTKRWQIPQDARKQAHGPRSARAQPASGRHAE